MSKIAVVSRTKRYADHLKNDLSVYFNDYSSIVSYSLDEINDIRQISEKCIVISEFAIFQKVKEKVGLDSDIVVTQLSVKKDTLQELDRIPPGTKVMVVNLDYRLCMEVISSLYAHGYKDFEFTPYFDLTKDYDPEIEIAITPGELRRVPKEILRTIDIGERGYSASCILEIAHILKIPNFTHNSRINACLRSVEAGDSNVKAILGEKDDLNNQVTLLLEMMSQGILITDISGGILSCNHRSAEILAERSARLKGFNITEILPELECCMTSTTPDKVSETCILINGNNIIITVTPIRSIDATRGFIITLDNFEQIEQKQHDIRTRLSKDAHHANYNFSNIRGVSPLIQQAVAHAKSISKSNSSVLITGDSGTGKEIFAQSIHNESPRKLYNFVAVNCAAIPENLLESEMFGYDEGSFTGAKKGGKIGYFELAHQGTIFLDELAEMPLVMQSKLLRVLEEKRMIRIGSNKLITVDVRIIAATNKNLFEQVNEGKFREDLFYRLNVLPLHIPSLSNRKEDILPIAEHFIRLNSRPFQFSPDAESAMQNYSWRGNVRELRNVIEYLSFLDKDVIAKDDLPFANNFIQATANTKSSDFSDSISKFLLKEGKKIELYNSILKNMHVAFSKRERIGRAKLCQIFQSNGLFYSEQEIRTCMNQLDNYGFIRSGKGRGGSVITPAGIQLKERIIALIG